MPNRVYASVRQCQRNLFAEIYEFDPDFREVVLASIKEGTLWAQGAKRLPQVDNDFFIDRMAKLDGLHSITAQALQWWRNNSPSWIQ